MRSVTSCFNSTLYRKTMARFWPLWLLYGVLWLFILPLNMLNGYFDELRFNESILKAQEELLEYAKDIPDMLEGGVWIALFAGILAAMAVFGYLYNNRSAGMMHTLPMRRETLYFSQYLAGLSFLLLPHLVVALLTAAVVLCLLPAASWIEALGALAIWLLGQSGTCLFFFSFAVFCAMFTGHILALPAFYGILNGLVAGVYAVTSMLLEHLFYGYPGVTGNNRLVTYCTPVWALCEACNYRLVRNGTAGDYYYYSDGPRYLESPKIIAAYAAVGVVLAVLALMVYRRRHVESAGDVVSVSVVRPIFRSGVSFCAGLAFGTYTAAFFGWSDGISIGICVVLWSVVGWFAAEMLLKKSFRVLRGWPSAAVNTVVMALLCVACCLDWFGIETRVPKAEDVESVRISGNISQPYDRGQLSMDQLTDPKAVAQILALHQAVINQRDRQGQPGDDYVYLYLAYSLKDGSTLERDYRSVPIWKADLEQEGTAAWAANQLIQNRELVEQCYNFDQYEGWRIVEAYLSNVYKPNEEVGDFYLEGVAGEDLEDLWQAVRKDFDEGTLGVRYLFDDNERRANTYVSDLCFVLETPESEWEWKNHVAASSSVAISEYFSITMTPNAEHTLAWLEEHTHYNGPDSLFFRYHELYDEQGNLLPAKDAIAYRN